MYKITGGYDGFSYGYRCSTMNARKIYRTDKGGVQRYEERGKQVLTLIPQ